MAIKVDNYINKYVVNQLFSNNSNNPQNNNNIVETLQNLSEQYASISAYGKKLNDIYNELTQRSDVTNEALAGARNVIVNLSQGNGTDWMQTVEALDKLKNSSEFEKFFEAANTIHSRSYDMNNWLKAFVNATNYGYEDQFIKQTNEILKNDNTKETANVFDEFINSVNDIATNVPNDEFVKSAFSNFFEGMASRSSLEEKNAFMDNFKAG
ncbi:hypothetical protein [Hippea maritima]|uniref:Uncharacterized protein n=1 Tax=Hippea maritima (strain ATCC 700847 / DSM 10411 / MH2) TaxID=760142 RepID=F2LVR4_HIPMA|nr:hypothetical protein [Hippea maritima]AEA33848.1 hypothetical protein Hipma_0878 [Hippea maritima DSM 10411]